MKTKQTLGCLLVAVLVSACGKSDVSSEKQNSSSFDAEAKYYSLPQPDQSVKMTSGPMFGYSATQRSASNIFCRKFNGGSGTNPFSCWQSLGTGSQAESMFNSLSSYKRYSLTIGSFIGGPFLEESANADDKNLCRKSTIQSGQYSSTYECFKKL